MSNILSPSNDLLDIPIEIIDTVSEPQDEPQEVQEQGDDKQGDDEQGDDEQEDDEQEDEEQGDDEQGDEEQEDEEQEDEEQEDEEQKDEEDIKKLQLQLGDVIQIYSPSDLELNNNEFYIIYIDPEVIKLASESGKMIELYVTEDGSLRNESIEGFTLISRADSPSYAIQNDLVPGKWIDVHFGGDEPLIITGKITNLEEDMIELTSLKHGVLYIDFNYKGIPNNLPIKEIVHRISPDLETLKQTGFHISEEDALDEEVNIDEVIEETPIESIRKIILKPEDIVFGDDIGDVTFMVDVDESEQRYGIDIQTTDLLDDILSSIPNAQRTQTVLNNIHRMIERYKQLRKEFSTFDKFGNAIMPAKQGADFKPLVDVLDKFKHKLYWILPVTKIQKKLFDIDEDIMQEIQGVYQTTLANECLNINNIVETYKANDIPDRENSYKYLINSLTPYLTPYLDPTEPCITQRRVKENMLSLVDNVEDFYSAVAKDDYVKYKRFLTQGYTTGFNMLETSKTPNGQIITESKVLTNNDNMCVKSIFTLPEPAVKFSHINLPSTNILTKSNLNRHFIQYWKLLNKQTTVSNVTLENLTDPIEYTPETFLNTYCEYLLDDELLTSDIDDKYRKFLEVIIPKTRILFELVKPYIKNKLSIYEVLNQLEPFMIYQRDLSYKQYEAFVSFITNRIIDYKREYARKSKELSSLGKLKSKDSDPTLINILDKEPALKEAVMNGYKITDSKLTKMTNLELLLHIQDLDGGELFNNAVTLASIHLMVGEGLEKLTDLKQWSEAQKKESNDCEKYVLAKKYYAVDEMEEDDEQDIYFDKKYDPTFYSLIDEYRDTIDRELKKALPDLEGEDSRTTVREMEIDILSKELIKNIGLDSKQATRDATAMVDEQRKVIDGDYAILSTDSVESAYYVRENNRWIKDNNITSNIFTDDSKLFCNLNEKCFEINKECLDLNSGKNILQKENIEKVLNEFDTNFQVSLSDINKKITEDFKIAEDRIQMLYRLKAYKSTYIDRKHSNMGVEDVEIVVSPHERLRDLILGQNDFVKKQGDIVKFVTMFTRTSNDGEDPYWLYCIETNIKILPTFLSRLASAFVEHGDYVKELALICKEQGTISDDGDSWVDKHSGYVIRYIELDTEEGFTDDGFKMLSRELLETDLGDTIGTSINKDLPTTKKLSQDGIKVSNIINAIGGFLGLDLGTQHDFIIRNVLSIQSKTMPTEEAYNRAAAVAESKGKKKIDTYANAFNSSLIILTLNLILIAIQTSIPQIKTRKTHPGCKKGSLYMNTGYPLNDDEDNSGLIYIACVAHKIKSSIEPWNSIKKMTEATIVKKMTTILQKFVLKIDEIQQKIKDKQEYLLSDNIDDIPESHSIIQWRTFLPQLQSIKSTTIENITDEFKKLLKKDLQSGSKGVFEKILVLRSKVIYYSLLIQEDIQKVVSEGTAILMTNVKEPFIENACCDDGNINTFKYFSEKQPSIIRHCENISNISNYFDDITRMSKAQILFVPLDTKYKYPNLSTNFSESTIYQAFFVFCKYNSHIPVSEELRALCHDKPISYISSEPLEKRIKKMKSEGKNFTQDKFDELMDIVNNSNIVDIHYNTDIDKSIDNIRHLLDDLDDKDSHAIPQAFRKNMIDMINLEQVTNLTKEPQEMINMKNYLGLANENMMRQLIKFTGNNLNKKESRKMLEALDNIINLSDENIERTLQETKNFLRALTYIFPDIIINETSFENAVKSRNHWKLSEKHVKDINDIISNYYSSLIEFYGEEDIRSLLRQYKIINTDIAQLISMIEYMAPVKNGSLTEISIFDKRMCVLLCKYFIFASLIHLVELVDSEELLYKKTYIPEEEGKLYSVDELEDMEVGNITALDIVDGDKKILSEKVSKLIYTFSNILYSSKKLVDYNYDTLSERLLRSKEKEKDIITDYLKQMTDEEREIENMFKNHKLGKWNVGIQKGFRVYDENTYDAEREALEKQTLEEMKLNKTDIVTDMNRDIYAMDHLAKDQEEQYIDNEVNNLDHLGNDDDYGELDGDEFF
tara:strand:+ start:3359 stop:9445 length:6087 start_codon:yes stop_codon:yes gene_type:complete